jgi:hypothetical protein
MSPVDGHQLEERVQEGVETVDSPRRHSHLLLNVSPPVRSQQSLNLSCRKADLTGKIKVVINWRSTGGVLIMGYDTFQIITNEKTASKVSADEKKAALEALIDPGPDLVVCDEGHMLKNGKTLKTQAVMRVKTKRRIVLTGTPLQNNLKECRDFRRWRLATLLFVFFRLFHGAVC